MTISQYQSRLFLGIWILNAWRKNLKQHIEPAVVTQAVAVNQQTHSHHLLLGHRWTHLGSSFHWFLVLNWCVLLLIGNLVSRLWSWRWSSDAESVILERSQLLLEFSKSALVGKLVIKIMFLVSHFIFGILRWYSSPRLKVFKWSPFQIIIHMDAC